MRCPGESLRARLENTPACGDQKAAGPRGGLSRRNEKRKFDMTFKQLGLSAPILNALEEQGYVKPSPIQEKAIPPH